MIRRYMYFLSFYLLLINLSLAFHNNAQAGTSEAGSYLESTQNIDGSWGSDPSTTVLF